jgi:hypothetical protein
VAAITILSERTRRISSCQWERIKYSKFGVAGLIKGWRDNRPQILCPAAWQSSLSKMRIISSSQIRSGDQCYPPWWQSKLEFKDPTREYSLHMSYISLWSSGLVISADLNDFKWFSIFQLQHQSYVSMTTRNRREEPTKLLLGYRQDADIQHKVHMRLDSTCSSLHTQQLHGFDELRNDQEIIRNRSAILTTHSHHFIDPHQTLAFDCID